MIAQLVGPEGDTAVRAAIEGRGVPRWSWYLAAYTFAIVVLVAMLVLR
jgi:hypothetical protein